MKKITFFVIILLTLSFTSCIEYTEKMKLNNDGSGEITFAVGLSEGILNMGGGDNQIDDFNEEEISNEYKNKDGIKFINSRSYSKDGNSWIEIILEFESPEKLQQASKDSSGQGMIGIMTLELNDNGNWVFTRRIFGDEKDSEKGTNNFNSPDMMAMMFSQYKWHYELTLPSRIVSTNAKEEDIDRSTNTIKWTFSLASLTEQQLMTVTFEKPKSSNIVYIMVGALLLIVLSIAALNLAKKKKVDSI